jgi:hypothetical protein
MNYVLSIHNQRYAHAAHLIANCMDRPAPSSSRGSLLAIGISACMLLIPVAILGLAAHRYQSGLLVFGAVAQLLGAALLIRNQSVWKPPTSSVTICLYLLALGWFWFATHESVDWFVLFGRGLFLIGSVGLLILHDMTRTGLEPRRRARVLCNRLLNRTRWPKEADEYIYLSEVWGLSRVVRDDPTLAFNLFKDARAEVQLAALKALQNRTFWRWDEAAVVLGVAKKTTNPDVRASALTAISTADNIDVSLGIIEYLKDPFLEVRTAACEALLAGGARRWAMVRNGFRNVMADPSFLTDGALPGAAGKLPAIAVCDLTAWSLERPPLSERTTRTLLAHHEMVLHAQTDPALASELGRQVTDPETPPMLRVELATLLRNQDLLPSDLLDRMTDPVQPSPIRLIAVETMLSAQPMDTEALSVLRGLGRQPNRETALAIARILQRHCQLDFGLPNGELNPKIAAEVTHRVNQWALGKNSNPATPTIPFGVDHEDALGGLGGVGGLVGPGGLIETSFPTSVPGVEQPRLKPRAH